MIWRWPPTSAAGDETAPRSAAALPPSTAPPPCTSSDAAVSPAGRRGAHISPRMAPQESGPDAGGDIRLGPITGVHFRVIQRIRDEGVARSWRHPAPRCLDMPRNQSGEDFIVTLSRSTGES